MRRLLFSILLLAAAAQAQQRSFPVSQYLNIRSVGGTSLSPDGNEVAFLWNPTGTNQVWKVSAKQPWPQQLTAFEDRVSFVSWSPAGNTLLIGKDAGGNERTQLYLLAADGSFLDTLTSNPKCIYGFGGWSHDGRSICYTSNERDDRFFDVYLLDVTTRTAKRIYQQDGNNSAAGFSPDDRLVLVTRSESNYNDDIFAVEVASGKTAHLTPHEGDARFAPLTWSPDAKTLYVSSDYRRDFLNIGAIDMGTKKFSFVQDVPHDVTGYAVSEKGTYAIMVTNVEGTMQWDFRRRAGNAPMALPRRGDIQGIAVSRDEKTLLLRYSSATSVASYFLYSIGSKKNTQIIWPSYAGIPVESFVEPACVRYPSFDGRSIPAFLYLPKIARQDRSLPGIVEFHGGPEGQAMSSFNPLVQFYVSRGYAVLQPNIRGSTGYGKEYMNADNARKRKDAIEDGAKAAEYLASSGWVNPKKLIAMGGSYGGYMTLAQVAFHPELWAAGVDIVGISNFLSFLKNTGAWRARHRAAEYGDLEKDADFLKSVSPLNSAERIAAPMLVVQGANDPRVPKSEADQIVQSIRGRNGIVEYLLYPDEGHGLVKLPNRISCYGAIISFLDKQVKNK